MEFSGHRSSRDDASDTIGAHVAPVVHFSAFPDHKLQSTSQQGFSQINALNALALDAHDAHDACGTLLSTTRPFLIVENFK